jgi:hypothetical protein
LEKTTWQWTIALFIVIFWYLFQIMKMMTSSCTVHCHLWVPTLEYEEDDKFCLLSSFTFTKTTWWQQVVLSSKATSCCLLQFVLEYGSWRLEDKWKKEEKKKET